MNLDIRRNIYENLKGETKESLLNTINDGITSNDEVLLPGLGVLFEIVWNLSSTDEKNNILSKIEKEINKR